MFRFNADGATNGLRPGLRRRFGLAGWRHRACCSPDFASAACDSHRTAYQRMLQGARLEWPTMTTRKQSHTLSDHVLGQDFVHEHDGDADHDHDHFEFDADGPLEDNPLWIQDHVTLVTRRHRHRLGGHAGHLLPHQPAPLRRGSHQPLLRRVARDPVPVAGRADALCRAKSASTTRRSATSSTRPMRRRGLKPGRHRHRRGHPHRRGAAARERARPSPRCWPSSAAISSAPPPAITWNRCSPPTARARRRSRTTRASASSTSTSAAAPPSSPWSRRAT